MMISQVYKFTLDELEGLNCFDYRYIAICKPQYRVPAATGSNSRKYRYRHSLLEKVLVELIAKQVTLMEHP